MDELTAKAILTSVSAFGAAITMFSGMANAIGEGIIGYKAVEAIARQPEAVGDITRTMLVGQAVTETTGIYAFVIALALLFANPLVALL
ncbi:MAG: ATP synthase F0 subunit C [Alkaliphilus sp.]|nr:ATP synthase F0 subunit C [Alkaliphilus sp.]